MSCRHRRTWLVAGGYWEWCYQCGAIREMRMVGEGAVTADTYWQRPTGMGGENPAMEDKPRKLPRFKGGKA